MNDKNLEPMWRADETEAHGTVNHRTPTAPSELAPLLSSAFGFASFRPHQEAVCKAATLGADVLLVMPTGAGKSLCYQLPGIARGGTTLVVSPLIALMEDQATKLAALGFATARIHSGRDRESSRRACADYLGGRLDFLFIAPERLAVVVQAALGEGTRDQREHHQHGEDGFARGHANKERGAGDTEPAPRRAAIAADRGPGTGSWRTIVLIAVRPARAG